MRNISMEYSLLFANILICLTNVNQMNYIVYLGRFELKAYLFHGYLELKKIIGISYTLQIACIIKKPIYWYFSIYHSLGHHVACVKGSSELIRAKTLSCSDVLIFLTV